METDAILAILRDFTREFAAEYRLSSLGVFGSFARNEARSDSDLDVVFETWEPNLFRTARLREELESRVGRHVDIVRLREHMNPSLKARIVHDAIYV